MYLMYYSWIKGPDPLIFGRNKVYVVGVTQPKQVPPIQQLVQNQYLVRIPISRLEQPVHVHK
jgi:hypothetical protein